MTQWIEGSTGRLPISDFTCRVVKQQIVHGPKSKNTPYLYEVLPNPDLTSMSLGELEVIERNAFEIARQCIDERQRREQKETP